MEKSKEQIPISDSQDIVLKKKLNKKELQKLAEAARLEAMGKYTSAIDQQSTLAKKLGSETNLNLSRAELDEVTQKLKTSGFFIESAGEKIKKAQNIRS